MSLDANNVRKIANNAEEREETHVSFDAVIKNFFYIAIFVMDHSTTHADTMSFY